MTRNIGLICIAVIYFGSLITGCVMIPLSFIANRRHDSECQSVIATNGDHWTFDKLDQQWRTPADFYANGQITDTFSNGSHVSVNTWLANVIIKPDVPNGGARWAYLRHPGGGFGKQMGYGRWRLEIHVWSGEQAGLARIPATI